MKLAISIIVAVVATTEAISNLPRAAIGDGFMHLPVRSVRQSGTQTKREDKDVGVSLNNRLELYTVEIEIGTPPQKTFVSIDTGSSELWVNPNCSSVPETLGQRKLCEEAPFYNVSKSSSAQGHGAVQTIGYGSRGEELTGVILNMYLDTVSIGDASVMAQRLGVPSQARGLSAGIMGLGPSPEGWTINETYPFLIDNLSLQKVINSRAYSLALGSLNNSTGTLLFGGVDTKKFTGKLAKLPIVDAIDGPPRLTIDYKSLSVASSNSSKSFDVNSTNVLVDSGSTFTKLEASLTQQIWDVVGAKLDNDIGYPLVDCSNKAMSGGLTFGFGGVNITVSFSDMVYEVEGICAFGIVKTVEDDQQILGDSFLRSAYAVFDLDNKNIHLAQYQNCGSEIVAIGKGEDAVPDVIGSCGSNGTVWPTGSGTTSSSSPISTSRSNAGAAVRTSRWLVISGCLLALVVFY